MDYEITYKSGKNNAAADALSRRTQESLNSLITTVTTPELVEEIKESWNLQDGYSRIVALLQSGKECKHFSLEQGILRRKGRCVIGPSVDLRRKLLSMYHDGVLGGHSGAQATYKKLGSVFYWPKLEKDVRQYVRECQVCQRHKYEHVANPGLL